MVYADVTFTAKQALDCLISVPFNPAVASRFISGYYNDTIQYQSTLKYLENPPSSYQQPPVDLLAGLDQIQRDVDTGAFPNQYAFEVTLKRLVNSAHDAHLQFSIGLISSFTFVSPYPVVALSEDGIQDPKVYLTEDVIQADSDGGFTASPIKAINGQDVTAFLTQFAARYSTGNIDPHTDWNGLMSSWARYIQNDYSVLESYIDSYPGETITVNLENGTTLGPVPWQAIYNSPGPTGPLATGGDFYNFFVLGFYPASFDPNAPDPCSQSYSSSTNNPTTTYSSSATTPTATSWPDSAYPETPDIFQPALHPDGGGFLTGYFLRNISTAVLSIPTFAMFDDDDVKTFSDTVARFLKASYAAGMQKILLDLQGNSGGDSLLAVDTFKHFFPSNDTFRGNRLRAHPQADILGNTFTYAFDHNTLMNSTINDALSAWPWVATDRLNAETGQNFTSWGELFGPVGINGDTFTRVQRDNISSSIFDQQALGIDIVGAAVPAESPQLYRPENIIILSDGLCSSACSLFVEMMHYEAGVKTVVVGGSPRPGPMQVAGGSRGVQLYLSENIDVDVQIAAFFNSTTSNELPNRQTDYFFDFIGINLRDQVRKGQEDVPLQFIYDAADCRIFYTAETWKDYASLWASALNAISNPKLCIDGSTGFATTSKSSSSATTPPSAPKTSASNASVVLAADDIFSGRQLGGPVLKFVNPKYKGAPRTASQRCTNSPGQGCSIGRCQCTPNGQQFIAFSVPKQGCSGTCPVQEAPSNDPQTYLRPNGDHPAEINGEGRRKKGSGLGTVGEMIAEIWAGHGGGN